MAGGIWTSQNKTLPGVYINVKSKGNIAVSIGERGTVAIAEPLSWDRPGSCRQFFRGKIYGPTSVMISHRPRQCFCGK